MNRRSVFAATIATVALAFGLAASPSAEAKGPKGPTLVDVATAANSDANGPFYQQLDTLIAAVLAADPAVLARLTGNGQTTVFAPTDDAFDAALASLGVTIDELDPKFLTDVLLYHVVTGRRDANQVLASEQLRTLQRGFLRQAGGVLTDNLGRDAAIIATDVPAANGIIHVIDNVVLPYAP